MSQESKLISLTAARGVRQPRQQSGGGGDEHALEMLGRIVAAQSEIASAGPDPRDVVDAITRRAQELTGSAGAVVEIADGPDLRYWSASGVAQSQVGLVMPATGSLSGLCIESNQVLRCDDSETDPRVNREACRRVGLRSMLVAPLRFRSQVVGVLKVLSPRVAAYGPRDQATLEQLCTLVAASLHKAIEHAQMKAALDARRERDDRERRRREDVRQRVRDLLAADALQTALQPIVRLADGRVFGYEALARFPLERELSTSQWFQDAAEVGLSVELELACARLALARQRTLPADAYLALNLSPETACTDALPDLLAGFDPTRLVLEITEHTPVQDYAKLAKSLDDLQRQGVRIAVDDAGAGFASLRHVLRLAPDIIKLDGTLTRDIDSRPRLRSLVSALLTFASGTSAELIAEGVETEAQRQALLQLGVPFGQGYHLGRPQLR